MEIKMKSNDCVIKRGGVGLESILAEVEKVAEYNKLPQKETLRLRLLAEELVGMLPELVKNFEGVFWVLSEGNKYELHTELFVDTLSREKKQALIAVSASNKNAAAVGFMGKIRDIAQNMLLYSEDPCSNAVFGNYLGEDNKVNFNYTHAWTLEYYLAQQKEELESDAEEWDRLEKSIVAKLADDVIVGVIGQKVEIIIKKEF